MSDKSMILRIKAVIKACEEAKKNMIPTFYETAEATAYERIMDIVMAEKERVQNDSYREDKSRDRLLPKKQ